MEPEKMTHEVTCSFDYGAITFQIAGNFYGEGTFEEGLVNMLTQMYPAAIHITVTELPED